jgi:predicted transcriptional regulator
MSPSACQKKLRDRLEALSTETRRSKSFLLTEAIQQFVETEEEIVLGIKQAQTDLKAGLGIPPEEIVKQSRAYLDAKMWQVTSWDSLSKE